MQQKFKIYIALGLIAGGIIALAIPIAPAFTTVDEGEVAVETNWGEYTGQTYNAGQHWLGTSSGLIGFMPNGISYSTNSLTTEAQTMELDVREGLSQDGQDVNATISVTYSLDSDQAGSFYSDSEQSDPYRSVEQWQRINGERAVVSAVQDATASVSTQEMVENVEDGSSEGTNMQTLRSEILSEVETQLNEENDKNTPEIQIRAIRIEQIELSGALNQSLEDIAIENAESERKLVEAEADANAQRERAEGQADAFNTVQEAYGSTDAALQAEWIEAINEDEGTIVLDAEAAPILDLNQEQFNTEDDDNED